MKVFTVLGLLRPLSDLRDSAWSSWSLPSSRAYPAARRVTEALEHRPPFPPVPAKQTEGRPSPMRRPPTLPVLLVISGLLLAGCASSDAVPGPRRRTLAL